MTRYLALAVPCLAVLLILPGTSFYFDVTPKIVLLLLAAALFVFEIEWDLAAKIAAAYVALGAIAAWASPFPALALEGSTWRRTGVIAEAAVTVIALALRAYPSELRLSLNIAGAVTSVYAIAQYFGVDPLLGPASYRVGEGVYQIVRPPATLGHSDYLGAFLLWPVLGGGSLPVSVFGAIAIVLTGSRGALLGLAVGGAILLFDRRPALKKVLIGVAAALVCAVAFYISPLGTQLRARAFWISEDSAGGARILLWRDTLRMSASHPLLGFGPDTFAAIFPRYESRELARAYPDFAHESPHNVVLDALYSRGAVGVVLLLAMWALMWRRSRSVAGGAFMAHQFICFTAPIAMLMQYSETKPRGKPNYWCAPIALVFAIAAFRLASSDYWVARADHDPTAYRSTSPAQANLYFARKWSSPELATLAVRDPEQAHNAWYQSALLAAQRGEQAQVELGLRAAIAVAPNWYKPHWTLSRLLSAAALPDEARREAQIAINLNGGKNPEVAETLAPILRSAPAPK